VKKELADLTLTKETFKKELGGGMQTLTAANAAGAFYQQYRSRRKYYLMGVSHLKKTLFVKIALAVTDLFLLTFSGN
jgi:hypothetical protein